MKKRFLFSTVLYLFFIGHVLASDVLTVENVTLPYGSNVTLEVSGQFDTQIKAFQFDVDLPEGLALVTSSGIPVCEKGFTGTDHTVSASQVSARKYRFICTSLSNALLPSSGLLLQMTIVGTGEMSVGDVFTDCKVSAIELTASNYDVITPSDVSFSVTVGDAPDTRITLDETSTVAPESATGVDVRVKRTIKANEWSTICLPFAMTTAQVKAAFGDDVELAEFAGWETTAWNDDDDPTAISVRFSNVSNIEANMPYIIKVSNAVSEFTVDGVNIDPDDEPCKTVGKKSKGTLGTFTGSYVPTLIDEECLFLNSNQFWYSTGKTNMKGYRAYFYFQDVLISYNTGTASSRMTMSFDDKTTKITNINSDDMSNDSFYNLNGQRVKTPMRGIFIKNGKKIVVK